MGGPLLIQACLNGARPPAAHPALPITPAQLADDARAVAAAGADSVHLHPKDTEGLDVLDADTVDAVVTAVRVAVPQVQVSVTTGAWALPDPVARVAAIRSWTVPPDLASVNWHESGSLPVIEALVEREIGIEVGLWSLEDLDEWRTSPVRDLVRRVLIELPDEQERDVVLALARTMVERVRAVSPDVPILLHGEGESAWPLVRLAIELDLETRIGLEDTLAMPDGSPAPDNAALVATVARWRDERVSPSRRG